MQQIICSEISPTHVFSAIKHAGQATNDHIKGQAKDPEAFNQSITEVLKIKVNILIIFLDRIMHVLSAKQKRQSFMILMYAQQFYRSGAHEHKQDQGRDGRFLPAITSSTRRDSTSHS